MPEVDQQRAALRLELGARPHQRLALPRLGARRLQARARGDGQALAEAATEVLAGLEPGPGGGRSGIHPPAV